MESNGPACAICGGDANTIGTRYAKITGSGVETFCENCVAKDKTAIKIQVCDQCGCESNQKTIYKVIKKPQPIQELKICAACGIDIKDGGMRMRTNDTGMRIYECSKCMGTGGGVPDVWYGYGSGEHTEENIAYPNGHPKAGQPIPFSSRRGKMEAMQIAGMREAGDKGSGHSDSGRTGKGKKTYFT